VNSALRKISSLSEINKAVNWADGCLYKIIQGGKEVYIEVGIFEDDRSLPQNSKIWAIFTDMEKQLSWHGQKMSKDDWKDLLCHEWKAQKLVPAISGGFCILNARTSKASKKEIGDLIEISYAFGSSHRIKWSEPSLRIYEEYSCNSKYK